MTPPACAVVRNICDRAGDVVLPRAFLDNASGIKPTNRTLSD
jgi:hypothetical protein